MRRQVEQVEEEFADDTVYEEVTEDAIANTSLLFQPLSTQEQELLQQMQHWARDASKRLDAKAQELLKWINTCIRPNGERSEERVLIFTEYRATQKWLYNLLAAEGLVQGDRLLTIYGSMKSEDREQIKAAFQPLASVSYSQPMPLLKGWICKTIAQS
ncbi:MAG: hypothetical protein KME01_08035 [Chroococcus sp. CMT-3BRIN-NPC107]|nr:hypothetical protein [Chroococcus sp. CMT-3BRIN-NPC107]